MPLTLVAGPHRCGTSMVARLLELCGGDLGSGPFMPPNKHNPAGYHENLLAVHLDDKLLALLGGSWRRPPAAPADWWERPDARALWAEARPALDASLAGCARPVIKDPRASLLLPSWLDAYPDARVVVCLRRPAAAVASLSRRDRVPPGECLHLWGRYLLAALDAPPERRSTCVYEDLLKDPRPPLEALVRDLRLEGPADWARVASHVDPRLDHAAAGPGEPPRVSPSALLGRGPPLPTSLKTSRREVDPRLLELAEELYDVAREGGQPSAAHRAAWAPRAG